MIRSTLIFVAVPVFIVAGCNRNSSPGNDRAAQIDAAPAPAPHMRATEALSGIATDAIQAETMNDADIASLGGANGKCLIRLTRVGFPSFVHNGPGRTGVIKLNGKLIPMRADRTGLFSDAGLRVAIRPVNTRFNANGLREADMIVMLPGAKDEIGYRGYEDCSRRAD